MKTQEFQFIIKKYLKSSIFPKTCFDRKIVDQISDKNVETDGKAKTFQKKQRAFYKQPMTYILHDLAFS